VREGQRRRGLLVPTIVVLLVVVVLYVARIKGILFALFFIVNFDVVDVGISILVKVSGFIRVRGIFVGAAATLDRELNTIDQFVVFVYCGGISTRYGLWYDINFKVWCSYLRSALAYLASLRCRFLLLHPAMGKSIT